MSRSFKRIATLVGVAALAASGFGLLVAGPLSAMGFGMSAGLLGISTTTLGLIGAAALTIGSLPGKPIEETGANDRGTTFADPDALGTYVFGTTTVPFALVYEEVTGASPDRLVHDVFAHAWHRINAYVSLTIGADDGPELVTFSGNAATGTHADMLWWFRALGNQVAALSGAPFDDNAWPSTAIGAGMAHSAIVWNVDDDAFKEKFAVVPTKLDGIVEAAMLYDPRLDPAYGSGSQDFGTPSGWTFNNGNAALVLLRMLIGERTAGGKLIWGRGAAETEIDMASFVAMANVADETLDSKPRFRLGGFQLLGPGHWEEFVQLWEAETGGKLSKSGGVYRVWLPHDDLTPLTTITEADPLAGHPVTHPVAGGVDGLWNTARGRYIEPTQGYRAFPYPDVVESTAVTDDGGERILYHDFSWVQDVSIAQRIARIKVRRSRFQRMWAIAVGWKGFGPNYKPFTVHTLTIKETGNNNEIVRVIHRELDVQTGVAILTLQQEDASIYDDTLPLGTPFASNTIPNRISQYSTTTPRYVDGSTIIPGISLTEMHDEFNYANADQLHRRWTQREVGIPDSDISALTTLTDAPGGHAMRFGNNSGNDEWWGAFTEYLIPYDPASTYEIGVFVRRNSGTANVIYCGFEGVANDGVTMVNTSGADSYGSQHYVAAAGALPTASVWTTYRGYLRGHGSTPTVPANDPSAPSVARTGITFIRPMLLVNFPDEDGQYDVAALWVRRLPNVGTPNIGLEAATEVYKIEEFGTELGWTTFDTDVSVTLDGDAYILIEGRCNSMGGTGVTWKPFAGSDLGEAAYGTSSPTSDLIAHGVFLKTAGTYNVGMRANVTSGTGNINDRRVDVVVVKR